MAATEWVGGRSQAPLFIEEDGGFQADVVVWMDATEDLVLGIEVVTPSAPDSVLVDVLRKALEKHRTSPARIRVSTQAHADLVSAVVGQVPVEVAPTAEIDRFVEVMGEQMPGANPRLAALRRLLHEHTGLVRPLLAASASLFRSMPWKSLWDSEVLQLDIPDLDVTGWCISVMGRAKQSWGVALFSSTAAYRQTGDASASKAQGQPALGAEALSLTFGAASEMPALLRRELDELGWELSHLDVYPLWLRAKPDGRAEVPSERDLRILLATAAGVAQHVTEREPELTTGEPSRRTGTYPAQSDGGALTTKITSPHPEVPWNREEL